MKQRDLITILITLFILTILWVVFSIYHNIVTSTIKDPLTFQIIPIEGKFDTKTIEKIKARQKINPLFDIKTQISPTPSIAPTPEASSESASLTETPTPEVTP